ncbi:unnamed protein product [Hanseniaspora opuntiae]
MSDFDSDSDDSFLEKHMDQYISSKDVPPISTETPKDESAESSDDSYLENYINQLDTKKQKAPSRGTTVTQDYDQLPEVYEPKTKLFSNYGLSSDEENEDTQNNNIETNSFAYNNDLTPDCIELPVLYNSATIDTLIYPTNYPVREYQRKIVETCIKNNTLVAIPTGTGKTFIAATIMLNFFRWFWPTTKSKIVFVAPTRPLVAQIIQACLGITGIPPEHMCILLDKKPKERGPLYQKNSVFIGTPQIIEKDLHNGTLSPHDIKLLIIDECHKSTGNFSYVKIVSYINRFCKNNFRIIGLSATPTNTVEGLENIVENLQVSKIELRTEESPDLKKYMMKKEVTESVVIPTDNKFIAEVIDCLSPCVLPILKEAIQMGIYPSIPKPAYINSFIAMENKRKVVDNPSLTEGLKWYQFFLLNPEKLKPHIFIGQSAGKKAFDPEQFILENSTKSTSGMTKKQREMRLKQIQEVKNAEKEIMKENGNKSRISSSEMAQNTGMTQAQQKEVIENFKSGKHNILVCTSIGEEGLDIGEVDLIIFFDATASLVRNIQRMGRTGRKRDGKVFLILTKREMDKFNKSFQEYEDLQQQIQDYGDSFMKYSCSMYPKDRKYQIVYDKISIANENEEIVNVDDADRVIALGTQMTQIRRPNGRNLNKGKATKKAPKTYNYPNNVDPNKPPGFTSVGNMFKKIIKNKSNKEPKGNAKKTVSFQEEPPKKFQKVVPGSLKKITKSSNTESFINLSD